MQRFRNITVRSLVATAVVMSAVVGTAPASASQYDERYCTSPSSPDNTDGVLTRSCWLRASEVYGDPAVEGWTPSATLRIAPPGLDPAGWSACQIRVAVFWKPASASSYTRYQTDVFGSESCVPSFAAYSQNNIATWWHGRPVVYHARACYYVITRWFGTYYGSPVGISASGPFPDSATRCGPANGVDLSASDMTPTLPDLPGVLTAVSTD